MNLALIQVIMLSGAAVPTVPTAPAAVGVFDIPDLQIGESVSIATNINFSGHPMDSYALVGTLPTGLTLDLVTGLISGTLTAEGTFADFAVTATNGLGSDTTNTDSMTVIPPESSGSGIGELFNLTELFNTVELHA